MSEETQASDREIELEYWVLYRPEMNDFAAKRGYTEAQFNAKRDKASSDGRLAARRERIVTDETGNKVREPRTWQAVPLFTDKRLLALRPQMMEWGLVDEAGDPISPLPEFTA